MTLPARFQGAIAAWLSAHASGGRRKGTEALSATYRAGGTSREIDFASYLVARLPATYAAVSRVFAELAAARPDWQPESLLDAGAGPGTASWAATECWPGLSRVSLLDSVPAFLNLAVDLAAQGPPSLAGARAVSGTIEALPAGLGADLVVAAYALAELPVASVASAVRGLWASSGSVLAIIEPGTPQGFARIRAAREALLAEGAVPVAPCSHALACPMTDSDWCHFSVRLARSRDHMHAKGARVPFEDERFSYLVMAREGASSGGGRILSPPIHAKPGMTFRLCRQGRIETLHVARREGEAYKRARKLAWGGLIAAGFSQEEDGP